MKKKTLLSVCITLLSLLPIELLSAQVYVLNDASEKSLPLYQSAEYSFDGRPAGTLTVEYKRTWGLNSNITVKQYIDGTWTNVGNIDDANDKNWTSKTFPLNPKASAIKFTNGGNTNKTIRNVRVTMATYLETANANVTMPQVEMGGASSGSISFDHSNMNSVLTVSSSNPMFVPEVTTVTTAGVGLWRNGETLKVNYTPTSVGTHTAVITVTDGAHTLAFNLTGTCVKRPQTITWAEGTNIIPESFTLENAASATSGGSITYVSDNTEVIRVEDGKLVGVKAGTANITATQAGDDTWAFVSATKTIEVTALEVQTITWEQDLLRLIAGDPALALTPTASSGLTDFTFEVADPAVATVSGNMLTPVAKGTTTITVRQAGNTTYAPAYLIKTIRVRAIGELCAEYVVNEDGVEHNLKANNSYRIDLKKPASKLSYTVTVIGTSMGKTTITEVYADNTPTDIYSQDVPGGALVWENYTKTYDDISVSNKAVALIVKASGGSYDIRVSNIIVDQATYFNVDKTSIEGTTEVGTLYQGSVTIDYSNISDIVAISHSNPKFILTGDEELNLNCGDFGTRTVSFSITPDVMGTEEDVITIDRGGDGNDIEIPITLTVNKKIQAITWNQDFTSTAITDVIDLTATSSSGLPITYTTSDAAVALLNEQGQLYFTGAGTAVITAKQEGNDTYQPAQQMEKTVTVSRIDPTINALPQCSPIEVMQKLEGSTLTGGTASVDGTFSWADPAVQYPKAGVQKAQVLFTPTNAAHYNNVLFDIDIQVNKAQQTISWEQTFEGVTIESIVALEASASSGLAVTYTVDKTDIATVENGTLTFLAAGTVTITALQPGSEDYLPAESVEKTLTVTRITPEVTEVPTASGITYGETLALSGLDGGAASVEGSFEWKDASIQPEAGTYDAEVVFRPTDIARYEEVELTVPVVVAKAANTIVWEQDLQNLKVSDTIILTATATSGEPVEYMFDAELETLVINEDTLFVLAKVDFSVNIIAYARETENYLDAEPQSKTIGFSTATRVVEVEAVDVTVYPNPATDFIKVTADADIVNIRIYTAAGQLMVDESALTAEPVISVSALPAGVYTVVVTTEQGTASRRIVVR